MPGRELEQLRAAMKREGADLCLVPSSDDHGSEYPAPYFEARNFCRILRIRRDAGRIGRLGGALD